MTTAVQLVCCTMSLVSMYLMARRPVAGLIVSALDTIPWVFLAILTKTYVVLTFDVLLLVFTFRAIRGQLDGRQCHDLPQRVREPL